MDGASESASACLGCARRENRTAKNIRNIVIVVDAGLIFCRIFRHQSGSSNRIGSDNPGGGVRDDARPSTNGHEWKFLRIFFIIFVQTTRWSAERYDNIMSIYVYNVIPARVCREKETVRTLTLTRYIHAHTHTHARTYSSDTQSRESVYLKVRVR